MAVTVTLEDAPDSDVDFLVDFEPGRSLLDLLRLADDLEVLLDDGLGGGSPPARCAVVVGRLTSVPT